MVRNDAIDLAVSQRSNPNASSCRRPRTPNEGGHLGAADQGVCRQGADSRPGLHQASARRLAGHIIRAKRVIARQDVNHHAQPAGLFAGIPQPYTVVRYHHWSSNAKRLPDVLSVTAESDDGEIMGVRHKTLPVWGVQFHPSRSSPNTVMICCAIF